MELKKFQLRLIEAAGADDDDDEKVAEKENWKLNEFPLPFSGDNQKSSETADEEEKQQQCDPSFLFISLCIHQSAPTTSSPSPSSATETTTFIRRWFNLNE